MLKTDVPVLEEYLKKAGVCLAYHADLQNLAHLAIVKENKLGNQRGSFLYPDEQMDLYDSTPDVVEDWYFTPVDLDKQFGSIRDDVQTLIKKIDEAIKRL